MRPDATISGPATPFVRRRQARPARPKDILIVLHQEHSTPGRVGRLIAERGHVLDIRRPRFGDPLPQTMQGHAGAVISGGQDTAEFKVHAMRSAGIRVADSPAALGEEMLKAMKG